MKILLVRTARIKQAITLGEFMYSEPIGLEMVCAILKDKHEVEIFDMMAEGGILEQKLQDYKPEAVGITSLCIDVNAVKEAADKAKGYNTDIITFVGGTQAYLNSEDFYTESIDHVFKYTTRQNMTDLFEYIGRGENPGLIDGICSRCNNYRTTNKHGINEYIHPDRSSTEKYRDQYSYFGYKPSAIMGTAQGCSKCCRFCLRWRIEGAEEKYFPLDFVIDEILSIQEDNIMIFDNDFLHNGKRLDEFCDMLQKYNISKTFICYASVNSILKNKASIKRFADIGLKAVLVGYETFKDEELIVYNKKSSVNENIEASLFLKKIGLDVWASFMLHPDWDGRDFKAFRRYIKKLNPEISSFSPLTPFPNLPLYKDYEERLMAKKEDYEKWSFGQLTIRPSKISVKEYYYEVLKTNLYVNLYMNNIFYITKKFGFTSILRLMKGSIKVFFRYIKLMAYAT